MQNAAYFKLLSFIVKENASGIEKLLKSDNIDFNDFGKFIWKNHLSGNLYSLLHNSKLRSLLPDTLLEQFKPSYLKQWTTNEKLAKEIELLSELFNEEGKEVIFLKGPFLAKRFYGNIDRRAIADIDFLVKKEDIDYIDYLIKRNGWVRRSFVFPGKSAVLYFTHHFEYERNGIDLELHWKLSTHFTFKLDYPKIWQQRRSYEFRNKSYWVLSDEYELVVQILSIFKDIELGTITLKSFLDAYMMLRTINHTGNWKEFFNDRKNEGIYKISIYTMDLVLGFLDCRNEFPKLASYIKDNLVLIKQSSLADKLKLLDHSRFAVQNKLWSFKLYATNPINSLCWWAISLPFRLITYRQKH
jgi:hypothetical protein